jgi:hypothetical protein
MTRGSFWTRLRSVVAQDLHDLKQIDELVLNRRIDAELLVENVRQEPLLRKVIPTVVVEHSPERLDMEKCIYPCPVLLLRRSWVDRLLTEGRDRDLCGVAGSF